MDVRIAEGRFADIGPTGTVDGPDDEEVLDGRGGYLLPGLWETHTHLTVPNMPATEMPAYMRKTLTGYLETGITSVCDLGGLYVLRRSERDTSRANGTAPALFVARSGFTGVNGWPANNQENWPEPIELEELDNGGIIQVDDADPARRHVHKLFDEVDYVKCMFDGATGGSGHRLPGAALDAIIETTHAAGKKVLVHIATGADLREAVRAGADYIEHSPIPRDPADPSEAQQIVEFMAEAEPSTARRSSPENSWAAAAIPPT